MSEMGSVKSAGQKGSNSVKNKKNLNAIGEDGEEAVQILGVECYPCPAVLIGASQSKLA